MSGEHEERDRADAKRKREEEAKEQEESTKRQRVIPTVKGKYRKSYEIEGDEYEEEEEVTETEQERHMQILTEQQKAIIQNQAELLQDQQKELDLQGSKIKKLIAEKKEKQKEKREEENVINVDDDEKKIKLEPSTSSGSGSGGAFRLENLFKRDVLEKFIPGYKTSQPETTDTTPTPVSTSTMQETQPSQTQPSVFVLTGTQDNILLLQSVPSKVTEHRSGKTKPVPKDIRLRHKHYCENCKSEFSRKDLLAQHIKNDCLQPICQFVCKDCNAAFYSETAVREHYYKIHLKIELYHCQKCNMGFAHKSKKSTHKKICPNKDGADQFPIRTHFDKELEASFKRRNIVPLQITDQQQPVQLLPQPPAPLEPTPQPVEPTPQVVEPTLQVVEPTPQLPQLPQVQGEGGQQLGFFLEIQPGEGRNVEDLQASDMLLALGKGDIPENIMEGDVEDQNVVQGGEGNVDDDDYEEDDEDGEEDYMVGGGDEVQETVVSLPLDDDDDE